MKSRIVCLSFLLIFLFSGCSYRQPPGDIRPHMVSRITVTCRGCEEIIRRDYRTEEKIRFFLLALRKLGPDFPTGINVDSLSGKSIHIRMDCTDGSQVTYIIKNNQYLQKNGGQWRQISPDVLVGFGQMILQMASDEAPAMRWDPLSPAFQHRVYCPAIRRIGRK